MADKKNRLSIFLIKADYTEFDQIAEPGVNFFEIDGVGTFYCEDSMPTTPGWIKDFFGTTLDGKFRLITSSAKGLLLFKTLYNEQQHILAIAFGHGRNLLNDDVVEDRFGLKVVLNSVNRSSLRSIDKTTLGSNPKQSREQISRAAEASMFGIDIEQDLLHSVTGQSKISALGKTISGRDSLSVSVKVDMNSVHEFAATCLERFYANDYKNDYDWVDQIKDVKAQKLLNDLEAELLGRLKNGNLEKIWMAAPDILDWVNVAGFKYSRKKSENVKPDLDLSEFLATFGDKELTPELIKSTQVSAISAKDDQEIDHWSAYKCLYAETELGGKVYILHVGKWYEIAKGFTDEVLKSFEDLPDSVLQLPNYTHANEGAYNQSLPDSIPNSFCLDADMIMHGGGHSSIEFCDLLTADKKLVHVKHYSGSAQLSHLFAQGVVSGELFVQDVDFRKKLNDKLPAEHKLADIEARPVPEEYEVVFAVISKSENPLEIPFFSKVSLRSATKRLRGYGYKVTKKKIQRLAAA